jgi:UDP-2-acetamido-2-deoxy-ribo-hexuluronate aminotransferase
MQFIDLKTQYRHIQDVVNPRIQRVLEHGQYILGPEVAELEAELAAFVGARYCITAASGTDALLMAMMALGIGRGDEVITTAFTFIATGETIALLGAVPVFLDVEPVTYNLDPAAVESAINERTRAIVPVSLYGQCADLDTLNAIADRHGLAVIEDAAQSFGARYKGRHSCGLSTIGCTSFFPSKPLGAYGDGGACFTNDAGLAKVLGEIRNHGQDRRYHHPRIGINGRLDTLQAAVLLAKMTIFPAEAQARERLGRRYSDLLAERGARSSAQAESGLLTPHIEPHNRSVYAQYTLQADDRDGLIERLATQGVPTAVHYPVPLNDQPAFADTPGLGETPVARRLAGRVLSLPMHPYLEEADLVRIADAVAAGAGL